MPSAVPSVRTARATAVVLAATALLALPSPAGAATGDGQASAVTAEVSLHVSLLSGAVDVPVDIALNKVQSPAEHSGSLLSAEIAGVAQPGPVTLVRADVGKSVTHVDAQGASASVQLVNADVHAPGLPLTTLLGLEALSSEVSCPVDGPPTAKVTAPAKLTVLGRSVALSVYGPTHVAVPGIGAVDIEFSKRTTTSSTAAASALEVSVALNPLNLNVAKVDGTITVASVSCQKPAGTAASSSPTTAVADTSAPVAEAAATSAAATAAVSRAAADRSAAPSAGGALASTGGGSGSGPLAAGGAALLAAGAGALWLTRRRRAVARKH